MNDGEHPRVEPGEPCPVRSSCCMSRAAVSRRSFMGALGGAAALTGLSWKLLRAAEPGVAPAPGRRPLAVKPFFVYTTYRRRHQSSWRSWGGIQTQDDVNQEVGRINGELKKLAADADFPVEFLPLASVRSDAQVAKVADAAKADAMLIYAANGSSRCFDAIARLGKPVVFFLRWRSGPVYLWYEIISPRYLRRHSDALKVQGMDDQDVVVDSHDDVLWRLRSLCGLKNTMGARVVCVGGPGGWATRQAPELAMNRWKLDLQTVTYAELGKLIQAARADKSAVALARKRCTDYLEQPGIKLEVERPPVENAFLLDQVFRGLLARAEARMFTINSCMGTIMPMAETTACLPLSLLNDDGYLAFCESDFVAIPAGILLAGISGRPSFLNDPTYPYRNIITLAHCTAPRKMDGKTYEPTRIVTHFESDYGAAPKVEMRKGQVVTNIISDFAAERWRGLRAEIVDAPFLPICRSQIDVRFAADSLHVAQRMPGFHWMTAYGDYTRELGYALKRTEVAWEDLG